MGNNLEIEGYDEVLREMEHDELVRAMKGVAAAITSLPKDDPELKRLLSENSKAINNFVEATRQFGKNEKLPEIKVETNQDKVVQAISNFSEQIAGIMKGIDQRLTALENKPRPEKLILKRGGWQGSGVVNEIILQYKK